MIGSSSKTICLVIVIWIFIGYLYLSNNQRPQRCMDFGGHLGYTKILVTEKRSPSPEDGWQTYQPPLYYLINSYIAPDSLKTDETIHLRCVEVLSVIYGSMFLWIVWWLLKKYFVDSIIQILVLLFIATTPKFIFIFSSYNNDSLATLLSVAIIALAYKVYHKWSPKSAMGLLMISTAGLYTKLTVCTPIFIVAILCCKNFFKRKPIELNHKRILKILVLSVLLFYPWLEFHNHKLSGKYFPSNFEGIAKTEGLHFAEGKSIISIVSPAAIFELTPNKWDDPFHHVWSTEPATKKNDYWTSSFINSIYGETSFKFPGLSIAWLLFWLHLFARIMGLKEVFKSNINKLAGFIILIAHLGQIAFIFNTPYAPSMDYRYIAWTWLGWAFLYSSALIREDKWSVIFKKSLILSIVIQFCIALTIGEEFR